MNSRCEAIVPLVGIVSCWALGCGSGAGPEVDPVANERLPADIKTAEHAIEFVRLAMSSGATRLQVLEFSSDRPERATFEYGPNDWGLIFKHFRLPPGDLPVTYEEDERAGVASYDARWRLGERSYLLYCGFEDATPTAAPDAWISVTEYENGTSRRATVVRLE